jgi:uncharacterized protein
MHLLRRLRREEAAQRLPELWRGFAPRPIRPATEWRPGLSVAKRPASTKRVHLSFSLDDIATHSARIRDIAPEVQ